MRCRNTSRRWLITIGLALFLGGIAFVLPAAPVAAGTQHVTSCADSGANTLRGKIAAAPVGDTVVFDQNCTITLASELTVTRDVTIDGTGRTVTISGNHAVRIFTFNISAVTATISNVTITNGSASDFGGGIYAGNGVNLTVTNTTFTGNSAVEAGGAIYATGSLISTVNVTNSTFINNSTISDVGGDSFNGGGAIFTNKTAPNLSMTVTNSTFTGNHSDGSSADGGAINNRGKMTVTNSTITGNEAQGAGGGISVLGSVMNLTNTIVAGNTQHSNCGAQCNDIGGGHTDTNVLIGGTPLLGTLGNYGGPTQTFPLLPGSPAIAAGATGAGIPTTDQRGVARTGHNDLGAFQSQGITMTKTGGDNQSQQVGAPFPVPLSVTIAATAAGAPYHEPVQGGVVTVTPPAGGTSATVIPSATVPANGQLSFIATANFTAGGPYTVTVSMSGVPPVAFSLTNVAASTHSAYTVGTTTDHNGGQTSATMCKTATNTTCTLHDALAYAQSGTDTVVFKSGLTGTITLTSGALILARDVTITGPGANKLAIDGGCTGCDPGGTPSGGVTVFAVNSGVTASISGLTIQHGHASAPYFSDQVGGGIANLGGTLTLSNSILRNNAASAVNGTGGALFVGTGRVTVQSCTISGNQASSGAGIYTQRSTLTVTNSTLTSNASDDGGAIYVGVDSSLTMTNSTLTSNTSNRGGAVYAEASGSLTVTNSTLSGNRAANGGGIYDGGTLTVTNSTLSGNSASGVGGDGVGGGIVVAFGTAIVTNSTITGNTASRDGGGIWSYSSTTTLTNTIVAANTTSGAGPDLKGAFTTGGHNLFGTTSGATITLGTGDLVTPAPLLGTLGNNGGPTQTIPLLTGSPAIGAGAPAVCAASGAGKVNGVDQRGLPRPYACSMGAYEPQITTTLPGPKPPGPVGGSPNPLPGARPPGTTGGAAPNPLPVARP